MRGVVVAVALCALVSGAEAKTWRCVQLGYSLCEGGKCALDLSRVSIDVRENKMREDMNLTEGDELRFTPVNRQDAVYAVTSADHGFEYGYCRLKVMPRR